MEPTSLRAELQLTFDEAVARATDALRAQGFGVLTDIDVQATLKQKIGVDVPRYRILGACNPPFAHRALVRNPEAGLMMPCNVIVREGKDGQILVNAVDPVASAAGLGDAELSGLAAEVRAKLASAMAALKVA